MVLQIDFDGSLSEAIAEIATIIPPIDITFFGQPAKQQRFAVSQVGDLLHVQIPDSESDKSDEILSAIAAL